MAQPEPYKHGYYLWHYVPSLPAAVIFCILFLSVSILLIRRMWQTRTWFCIVFIVGGYFEFVGYAARAAANSRTGKLFPYVIQNNYILLAPAFFAASVYMTLARIIRSVRGERFSLLPVHRLTIIFVSGDILTLCMQGGAAGMMVAQNVASVGRGIVIASLLLQICIFGFFAFTALTFDQRISRDPTPDCNDESIPWRQGLRMIYGISSLIMVRSVFRVIEFCAGADSYLFTHEWTMYIFDAILMFGVMVIYFVWYPSGFQRRYTAEPVGLQGNS
ncbi:RTA1 like protein [Coleophoma cylindrospora]|uniref:RTA1 like protein n=1 Tax=Coleophoma cylindrospora TaxID=1849047 RepID=A0A3D8QAF4_9HELO|nr:RTA1 like protein [Coleophoma cylindrospora]